MNSSEAASPIQSSKKETRETAILAGGCFWGVEDLFRQEKGVIETVVGYTGGDDKTAKYQFVKKGNTGHAEAIKITFDPNIMSYKKLLTFFFQIHDPTTVDQQGNDKGSQYRSEIFYLTDQQKDEAAALIKKIDASKKWKKPIVTKVSRAGEFYAAEEDHQDYLVKHPGGYTCHWNRKLDF